MKSSFQDNLSVEYLAMLAERVSHYTVKLLTLCLLLVQTYADREITCTPVTTNFSALILFQRNVESEDLCLNICYDYLFCKFVHFSKDNCTLYKTGSIVYSPNEITYELKQTLDENPICVREVPLRPTIQFEPIAVQTTENVVCSGIPSDVITIYMYLTEENYTLFSTTSLENFTIAKRLVFARTLQPHCVSVPVYTGPSNSRLYFGSVFNTSGYYFMGAYAFAGKCTCETGACCGDIAIDEYYWWAHGFVYANSITPLLGTSHKKENAQQQLYIPDAEWLI